MRPPSRRSRMSAVSRTRSFRSRGLSSGRDWWLKESRALVVWAQRWWPLRPKDPVQDGMALGKQLAARWSWPRIAASWLLTSWAMPPARVPTVSMRWLCSSCRCRRAWSARLSPAWRRARSRLWISWMSDAVAGGVSPCPRALGQGSERGDGLGPLRPGRWPGCARPPGRCPERPGPACPRPGTSAVPAGHPPGRSRISRQ